MRLTLTLTATVALIAGLLLIDSVHAMVYGDWDEYDAGAVS